MEHTHQWIEICAHNIHVVTKTSLSVYLNIMISQVHVVKYLRLCLDTRLIWKVHIKK